MGEKEIQMSEVNRNGIRQAGGEKKKVFEKGTYDAVLKLASRVPPNQMKGIVGIAKRYFDSKGVNSLEVDVMTLSDSVDSIVEYAKSELQGRAAEVRQSGERRQVEDYLSENEATSWTSKTWASKIKAVDVLVALDKGGFNTSDNRAPEGFVQGLVESEQIRRAFIDQLIDEKLETGAPEVICQAGTRHRGAIVPFAPKSRHKIFWEAGEPRQKTHPNGGGAIEVGNFLLDKDLAFEALSKFPLEKLEAADLMEVAQASYRVYCDGCVHSAKQGARTLNDAEFAAAKAANRSPEFLKLVFRTYAGTKATLEATRRGLTERAEKAARADEDRSFEAGAGKSRGPRATKYQRATGGDWAKGRDKTWRTSIGSR